MTKLIGLMIGFFSLTTSVMAGNLCHGSFVNPISDVCWSCLFPITIGNVAIFKGDVADNSSNPSSPVCYCDTPFHRVGITTGFWEPIALVDVTRLPFCMVNLGGIQLNMGSSFGIGSQETANSSQNNSFYYVHWYHYPLLFWLKVITDGLCLETGDLDIAYLTELDPMWRDEEWGFILNPEAILFGNPIAQAACAADSLAASSIGPIDKLFWCAGSQGSMYLTGTVQVCRWRRLAPHYRTNGLQDAREGLLWDSLGEWARAAKQSITFMPKSDMLSND